MTLMDGVFGKDSQAPAILRDGGRSSQPAADTSARCAPPGRGCHYASQGPDAATARVCPGDDAALRQQITHLYPTQLPEVPQPWFNPLDAAKSALGEALFFDPNLSRCGTLACASCHRPEHGFASPYQVPPGCDGCAAAPGANVVQCGLSGALFLGWTCAIAGAASAVAGGNASRVEQRLGCRAHLSQHRASYPYWQGVPAGARLLHRILRRGVQR